MTEFSPEESRNLVRLLDNLPGMVYRCRPDEAWTMEYVSAGAERLLGYAPDRVTWNRRELFHSLIAPDHRDEVARKLDAELKKSGTCDATFPLRKADGDYLWVWERIQASHASDGSLTGIEGFVADFSQQRQAEEMITYLAYYDVLTGLPNRLYFLEQLTRRILEGDLAPQTPGGPPGSSIKAGQTPRADDEAIADAQAAVVYLNLNRFTVLLKTLGHLNGDLLLKSMSTRLEAARGPGILAARVSGDEFLLLIGRVRGVEHARSETERVLREVFADSYFVNSREVYLTGAAGISVFPEHGGDTETLIRHADVAMKRAKQEGQAIHVYAEEFADRGLERLTIETALRKATERSEIQVRYQPKVNLLSGKIAGVEALARWRHPELGDIAPTDFIPIAEETGIIKVLGDTILETSIAQNRSWQDKGFPPVPVAVNISAQQFTDEKLLEKVARLLDAAGLHPRHLELEITESCLMHDPEAGIGVLSELKEIGVVISVDDFGTGYSSLSYLKRFPIDSLKIDRSFVLEMTLSPDSASIVRAIINLAHIMGLKVVAEGVETAEQLQFLRHYKCDEIQGYLFSEAVPADELERIWDHPLLA